MAFETYEPHVRGRKAGGIRLTFKASYLSVGVAQAIGVVPGSRVLVQFDRDTRVLRFRQASSGGGFSISKNGSISATSIVRWAGLQEYEFGYYADVVIEDGAASIQLHSAPVDEQGDTVEDRRRR